MKKLLYFTTAVVLVAIYIALTITTQPTASGTTPTTPTAPTTTPQTTPVVTTTTTPTPTPPGPQITPQPPAAPPTDAPPTYTETPRAEFYVELRAVDMLNTTRLPTLLNYSVYVKNRGNAAGEAIVEGEVYRLEPGREVVINRSVVVRNSGVVKLSIFVNGREYTKEVRVYYFVPIFVAKAVEINVSKLPTDVIVEIEVENVGNYTGVINGVEIPPGRAVKINKTVHIEAAGRYQIDLGAVSAPLLVFYHTPNLQWRVGGVREIEALPGEEAKAWLWVKNTGNASALLTIDGREIALKPGDEVNVTKSAKIDKSGVYVIEFKLGGSVNATVRHTVNVKIISYIVELVVWSPRLSRDWPGAGEAATVYIHSNERAVEVAWGYLISTNATKRSVSVVVTEPDGVVEHRIEPGAVVGKNFTISTQAPGSVTLWIEVNGSKYGLEIVTRLVPPRITIRDVSKIDFDDQRPERLTVKCGGFDLPLDLLRISGTLTYEQGRRSAEGTIELKAFGNTYVGRFSGYAGSSGGRFHMEMAGHQMSIETDAQGNPTRVLIDGSPRNCEVPRSLIPRLLFGEKPTASDEDVESYVDRLFRDYFAKSISDYPQSVLWNGEYVEVRDRRGRSFKVRIGERLEISGALTATIYFS